MNQRRILAFDVLRVIMLLLLIVFHAGVSFMETDLDEWFYHDSRSHLVFDSTLAFIHAFRHPLFFLISGFVTEQMYARYTAKEVVKRRVQRLFVPLLIVMLCVGPVVNILFALLNNNPVDADLTTLFPVTDQTPLGISTTYVWFLYYLVLFNIVHLGVFKAKTGNVLGRIPFIIKIVILIAAVLLLLLVNGEESMYGAYHLLPAFFSIGGYFVFYLFGISMAHALNDFERIKKAGIPFWIVGSVAIVVYYYFKWLERTNETEPYTAEATVFFTIACVFFSFGGLGLAIKYYTKENRTIRYISDSSYFLYLIHFPFNMLFLYLVAPMETSPFLKFLLIFIATLGVSFLVNFLWRKAWNEKPPI